VLWSDVPIGDRSRTDAAGEVSFDNQIPQLVLHGDPFSFGDGAALAPIEKDRDAQTWRVRIIVSGQPLAELALDLLPERLFEFKLIALKKAGLDGHTYGGLLAIHKDGPTGPIIGRPERGFEARSRERDYAHCGYVSLDLDGFLVLPMRSQRFLRWLYLLVA
jgi:hypothetical protein